MSATAVVVGAGGIAGAWFPALIAEGVTIAAVVDLRIEAARARIEQFHLDAEPSSDLEAALRAHHPDFVLDLTSPEAHCATTCAALEAGCHVLGEKPLAASLEEARRMVAAAERAGRLYMVSQNRRWDRKHEAVRRALRSGAIGEITTLHCDFFLGAHFGGFRDDMRSPLLLDMAIHHFDLARFFGGRDSLAVYAKEFNPRGSWYRGDASAACIFEMDEGVVFTYSGSWCAEGLPTSWNGDWRIVGSRGTLLYQGDQEPRAQVVAGDSGFLRPLRDVEIPIPCLPAEQQHGALRDFLECLRTGATPHTDCRDNIKSLAMVFAAIDSAREGRRLAVAPD